MEPVLFPLLDSGEIDLAFFWNYDLPGGFSWQKLDDIYHVCIGSKENAHFARELDAQYFETAPHVSTTTTNTNLGLFFDGCDLEVHGELRLVGRGPES